MQTVYFLLTLFVGWMLLVVTFLWMHAPERTVADLVRSVRSAR